MRLFSKLFNIRDNVVIERPRSLTGEGIASRVLVQHAGLTRASSSANSVAADTEPSYWVDGTALFYSLLFSSGKDSIAAVANGFEKRVTKDVEQALSTPDEVASNVLRLPYDIIELDRQLSDPEVDTDAVLKQIKRDPVLSVEVIKLCNSPLFKCGVKDITNLQQAVVALGREQLRRFVTSVKLREVIAIKPIYFRRFGADVWRHSLQVAYLASELTPIDQDRDTAFILGLLHDVGKIAIFQMLLDAFANAEPSEQPKSALFRKMMTAKSLLLSALLMRSWQLPPLFFNTLSALTDPHLMPPDALPKAIWTANHISECSMLWQAKRLREPELVALLNRIGMEKAVFDELHEKLLVLPT